MTREPSKLSYRNLMGRRSFLTLAAGVMAAGSVPAAKLGASFALPQGGGNAAAAQNEERYTCTTKVTVLTLTVVGSRTTVPSSSWSGSTSYTTSNEITPTTATTELPTTRTHTTASNDLTYSATTLETQTFGTTYSNSGAGNTWTVTETTSASAPSDHGFVLVTIAGYAEIIAITTCDFPPIKIGQAQPAGDAPRPRADAVDLARGVTQPESVGPQLDLTLPA